MLITISGLYGSGGNELGFALGKELGYPVYDGELISKAVEHSGLDMKGSTVAFYDEQDAGIDEAASDPYSNAVLSLQMDVLPIARNDGEKRTVRRSSGLLSLFLESAPISQSENRADRYAIHQRDDIERLKFAQAKVVLDAAEKKDGVFLGRCSSYILSGRSDCLRIFTCASMASCTARISAIHKLESIAQAEELIKKTNRRRAYYYETFTNQKWDGVENYDLCINTDFLGFDGTLGLLRHLIGEKSGQA